MQDIDGALAKRYGTSAPIPLMEAYAHFRLDRQAIPCSKATMLTYKYTLGAFLRWVAREHPEVRRFEDLDVVVVRQYRAEMAERPGLHGKTLTPETLSGARGGEPWAAHSTRAQRRATRSAQSSTARRRPASGGLPGSCRVTGSAPSGNAAAARRSESPNRGPPKTRTEIPQVLACGTA